MNKITRINIYLIRPDLTTEEILGWLEYNTIENQFWIINEKGFKIELPLDSVTNLFKDERVAIRPTNIIYLIRLPKRFNE